MKTTGIHHVTAITADAQANLDFYTGRLGFKLVKLTVNFDDPGSYHLYYANPTGDPGTIVTFFAWPGAHPGRIGPPQVTRMKLAVPKGTLASLQASGFSGTDPDGIPLDLVEGEAPAVLGVTLSERNPASTASMLTDFLGFSQGADGLFATESSSVEVVQSASGPGTMGAGTVHHVAFRAADDDQLLAWQRELRSRGFGVSEVMDRNYFHSIYFREPGGVICEIATDPPGFGVDEEKLGAGLVLPSWLEPRRAEITRRLPRLAMPA